jgi:hypothetical protein
VQSEPTQDDGPRSPEAEARPRSQTALLTAVTLGIAVVVAVGSVVLVHRSAARSDGSAGTRGAHSGDPSQGSAATNPGSGQLLPSRPAIPGVAVDTVVQQVKTQMFVPIAELNGYYTGHLVDPVLGADFNVTVDLANEPNTFNALACFFVQPGIVVSTKMIDTAARCVTLGVLEANRAAATSWLTSTSPKVAQGQKVQRDFGVDRLTIFRRDNEFETVVSPVIPPPASASAR